MKHPKRDHNCNPQTARGFTLVEMLLVLVILTTLGAIIYPSMSKHGLRARITATKEQMQILSTALSQFEMDNDHYPRGRNGLLELVQRPRDAKSWHGPYLEKKVIPKDAWGHDFHYECPGKHSPESYDILSFGPDGAEGTADDIASWQADN
jgi:general secretion pathway protein G